MELPEHIKQKIEIDQHKRHIQNLLKEIKERDEEIKRYESAHEINQTQMLEIAAIAEDRLAEIERLKGLIESYYIAYECQKHLRLDINLTDTQCEEMYQQFKTSNNL